MSFLARLVIFALLGVAALGVAWFLVMANREDLSELKAQCSSAQVALNTELPGASLTCAPADDELGMVNVAVSLPVLPQGQTLDDTRAQVEGVVKFRVKNVLTVDLSVEGQPAH